MPYYLKKRKKKGKTVWLIVRKRDNKVVGTSTSQTKAKASIWLRMRGDR
jgi:hypothetical protein